ncbi:MAG: methyltransferase domain-containing protein [Rhizobiales bacterium]|nr:methyltransferase domain-containing protein [Hyphomicrobiales bacterium]
MTELLREPLAGTVDDGPHLPVPGFIARLALVATGRLLNNLDRGSLTLVLGPGVRRTFIGRTGGADAVIHVHGLGFLTRSLSRGTIGIAESYLRGEWTTPDLAEVFRFFIDNKTALVGAGAGLFRVRASDTRAHVANANTREGSRRNIAAHYDLGNAFYSRWLDPSMTYSSALFARADEPLAEAQLRKYRRVADAIACPPGGRILEIGCGWGGFAEVACRDLGLEVHGITLSSEQLAFARERLARQGLAGRSRIELLDYRDTSGRYDGIASIEMIEAVGREHWPEYFGVVCERLRPGARAAIQAITISEELAASYRRAPDFIQHFIFPGGVLPTVRELREGAGRAGLSVSVDLCFASSYAETLWRWRRSFLSRWSEIRDLGFDERFRRMWDYYLTYCAVGFERRTIDVGIYVLSHAR